MTFNSFDMIIILFFITAIILTAMRYFVNRTDVGKKIVVEQKNTIHNNDLAARGIVGADEKTAELTKGENTLIQD
jgi:branched-subunit amino acid ABC-type transport system permease component